MENIFKIYLNDIRTIIKNYVLLIIITGLIVLPSLYAWFNIKASWDPYGSTSRIKVAVVNNDVGGVIGDNNINIGDKLIEKLKENNKLGWNFVDENEANEGLEVGRYYAIITIPEAFTDETISIIDKVIQRPKLIYKVNQKSNAIAPKITDKGVTTIKSEIDSNIIETVDGIVFKVLNEAGITLEGSKEKLISLMNGVINLNNRLPEIENLINEIYNSGVEAEYITINAKNNLPLLQDTLKSSNEFLIGAKSALEKSKEAMTNIAPIIKADLDVLDKELSNLENIIDTIDNIDINKDSIVIGLDNISSKLVDIDTAIGKIVKTLTPLSNFDENLKNLLKILEEVSANINSSNQIIAKIKLEIQNSNYEPSAKIEEIKVLVNKNHNIVTNILNNYDNTYVPSINSAISKLNDIADNSIVLIDNASQSMPNINNLLEKLENGLSLGKEEINKLREKLPAIKSSLGALSDKLSKVNNEEDLDEILSLLQNDWENVSKFLSSPVEIVEESIFSIPNYGSAMSPFYSTLALWVGGLILVSLLSTEVHNKNIKNIKAHEIYFGKMLIFLTLGIFQALILTVGDIYLLKCYVLNRFLFILISIISSIIFIIIIYTLVSLLGNIGKALAVILLVLQVAGSGGTFPVEVMPRFFRVLNPLLPFTYSISAMREAVAGIVKVNLISDLSKLFIFMFVFLLLGVLLKGTINTYLKKFKKKLNEGGLIGH